MGRQEDAHEYFICLLEALQAASLRKASAALPQGEKLPESIAFAVDRRGECDEPEAKRQKAQAS